MTLPTRSVKKYYHFKALLLNEQWLLSPYVGIDEQGVVVYLSVDLPKDPAPIEEVKGIALPGFQNAHSHAFQYAMAGMAERHKPGTNDDFWTWREAMYQCALSFDPDDVQTVATALYIDLLKRGYTHVAEFHYLHHDKNGKPYSNPSEISVSLLAAASIAGIRLTLIPVFYQKGGFGKEAQPRQRRFIFQSIDEYFRLLEEAGSVAKNITSAELGFGVHSLRAAEFDDVKKIESLGPKDIPFHIHAAEQLREVEECVLATKQRPVEWLVNNLPLSSRFNLVHCTHMTESELRQLARSGANVVLCPGTEANLGDGIFPLTQYVAQKGNWCTGTDSHISINPVEELRWLDYSQRLYSHKRNTFDDGGRYMITHSYLAGTRAMGEHRKDTFEIGRPFDAVVYDAEAFLLSDLKTDFLLSRILYTTDSAMVLGTLINGSWIVKEGSHSEEKSVRDRFSKTIKSLLLD